MFYTAWPVSVKPHWQEYRDIKAGGKKRQDLSVNSPVPTTSGSAAQHCLTPGRLWLRGFLQGLQASSVSALCSRAWDSARAVLLLLLSVETDAKTLWDSSLTTKKGEIHGSSILENQPNKQTAMYEKKAAFFLQLKKPQIPGKLQIKKANKQDEICRWKVYHCKLSLQNIKNIRFMIASAAFTELFLNIDIYYTIYLLLSVHFQRTNAEKKLTVVTQPGSGLIVLIIKPIPCELLWCTQEDALTKSPIDCLYWCTFFSYYFWMLHVFVCWESPPEVSNSFYHLFSISHSRNGGSEVCP